jgi:hypothetical protein
MRNLLQDADRDRLVAPLAAALAGRVMVGGVPHRALPEVAGSPFFAAEANARAAELLLLPGLREAHTALSDALLDFVMAMAEAPVPCRRAVAGGIELVRDDPTAPEARTPFFRLSGNLARGELRQALRDAALPEVLHSGNLVEFSIGRHRTSADVEEAIVEAAVERDGGRLVLRHVSRVVGRAGLFAARPVEAGTLSYRYELSADSPLLHLTLRFTAARRLSRLRVTTALDALGESGLGATEARLLQGSDWRVAVPSAAGAAADWTGGAPLSHLAIGRQGWPAAAPVLHLRPADPARVLQVTAVAREAGVLHWLLLRHGPAELARGETLELRETRLLGGPADPQRAAAMIEAGLRPEMAGLDLDPAPPSAAAQHAVAVALMFDAAGAWRAPLPEARRAALLGFATRQATRLDTAEPAAAELAHLVLAADALRRAGQAPMAALQGKLVARLRARVDAAGGLLRDAGGEPALTAQALAILALARSATWPEGATAAAALEPVLAALQPSAPGAALALGFAGGVVDPPAAGEALGLLGRAAGAVVLAGEAGAPVPEPLRARSRELHRVAVNLLRPMIRPREGVLEMAPRGVAEPVAQALATLAFLAPDRLVLPLGRVAA